ncbi:hypothetical protein A2635_00720 [Candidatus Peribacteria bacterium RIFCSPHIGHO2_01_FULL_51_9]|nr:MAG: hypothetical protein A2635_00720 [Candidatus Peribacteria bacterium RIFCSPHIGHO2_01_FULL_51_9]
MGFVGIVWTDISVGSQKSEEIPQDGEDHHGWDVRFVHLHNNRGYPVVLQTVKDPTCDPCLSWAGGFWNIQKHKHTHIHVMLRCSEGASKHHEKEFL